MSIVSNERIVPHLALVVQSVDVEVARLQGAEGVTFGNEHTKTNLIEVSS